MRKNKRKVSVFEESAVWRGKQNKRSASRGGAKNTKRELGKHRKGELGWRFWGKVSLGENMVEV